MGSFDFGRLPNHQTIQIEQVYLRARNRTEEVHIRKRGQNGAYLYFLSRRKEARHAGAWVEEEELIVEQEYLTLKNLIDPKTDIIEKERICFLWENRYFELDRYKGRREGLMILKVEFDGSAKGKEKLRIPPFIAATDNITADPRYLTRSVAIRQKRSTRREPAGSAL